MQSYLRNYLNKQIISFKFRKLKNNIPFFLETKMCKKVKHTSRHSIRIMFIDTHSLTHTSKPNPTHTHTDCAHITVNSSHRDV